MSESLKHFLLPLVMVVVMVVVVVTSAQEQDICSAAEKIVEEGDVTIISLTEDSSVRPLNKNVYVRPEKGFQGITVVAVGAGWKEEAWFPLTEQCISANSSWWSMDVNVFLSVEQNPNKLSFRVYCGDCLLGCYRNGIFENFRGFQIQAHGNSSWITTAAPSSCNALSDTRKHINTSSVCAYPLTNSNWVLTLVTVVVVVVVLMLVGKVVWVVAYRRYWHRLSKSNVQFREPASQTHFRPNSMHESNSTYENAAYRAAQGEPPRDSRNSL